VTETLAGQTVETARRALTTRFRTRAIDSAELDARILVGAALGLDLTGMIAATGRLVTATEAARLEDFARRRLTGEPVARVLGAKEFWGLPLQLSAATLVPRPDTETVVELALEMPRADFVACDYAAALSGTFDLIVSNPPYIRSAEITDLATEVRDHDPHRALDGGTDGLDAYRALIPEAARLLAQQGALVVEVGHGQSGDIEGLMTAAGLTLERPPKADLAGIHRAVAGRKLPS